MKLGPAKILVGFVIVFAISTTAAGASERSVAREVLVANAKSYKRFTEARFSDQFKSDMGAEMVCIDRMTKNIETSPQISKEETFGVLMNIYVVFPFDFMIESSRDKRALIQRESSRLLRDSKKIERGLSSARERLFVAALRAQAQTVRILSRIKGNVDFCQIEKNIGEIYTVDTVGIAFDGAFPGSWGPELVRSKGYRRAGKKINNAVFKMTMIKPRFSQQMINKFVYPPSLGMMMAWEDNTARMQNLSVDKLLRHSRQQNVWP